MGKLKDDEVYDPALFAAHRVRNEVAGAKTRKIISVAIYN